MNIPQVSNYEIFKIKSSFCKKSLVQLCGCSTNQQILKFDYQLQINKRAKISLKNRQVSHNRRISNLQKEIQQKRIHQKTIQQTQRIPYTLFPAQQLLSDNFISFQPAKNKENDININFKLKLKQNIERKPQQQTQKAKTFQTEKKIMNQDYQTQFEKILFRDDDIFSSQKQKTSSKDIFSPSLKNKKSLQSMTAFDVHSLSSQADSKTSRIIPETNNLNNSSLRKAKLCKSIIFDKEDDLQIQSAFSQILSTSQCLRIEINQMVK